MGHQESPPQSPAKSSAPVQFPASGIGVGVANPVVSSASKATFMATPMPSTSDPEAGSHRTLYLLIFLLLVGLTWRYYRKRQQGQRGWQEMGARSVGAHTPGFTL